MRSEVRDAIENARTVDHDKSSLFVREASPRRTHAFDTVRALVLAVAQELPSDMTMAELCDELAIANNQTE